MTTAAIYARVSSIAHAARPISTPRYFWSWLPTINRTVPTGTAPKIEYLAEEIPVNGHE